ncbi:hypothetical protein V5P93_002058 [Actinokineospora auranticolor]|nr:hypothetical protein [Actinokineospora auranticolor]
MTAGNRLLDLLPVLDGDHRVQVVFTVPREDDTTWHGVDRFVAGLGGLVVPWGQAVRHEWDAVLGASHRGIAQVHGKLLLLPHGVGAVKSRRHSRKGGQVSRETTGVDRELLTYRGRLLPAALAIPTVAEMGLLRRRCPEAVGVSFLSGDVCFDSLRAGVEFRDRYRSALGVESGEELVLVSSTWSPNSLFGRCPTLYDRLLAELSGTGTKVATVLHPNIWAVHGEWQIRSWLAGAVAGGLLVVPPERGWQAATVAADAVVGDHGSTTTYAAALGKRVCLATWPEGHLRPESPAAALRRAVPLLDLDRSLRDQLAHVPPVAASRVVRTVSGVPGGAHARFRKVLYRLLDLPEPAWPAATPIPLSPRVS